jgi:Ca2+-binding EF-hand superfamily protein
MKREIARRKFMFAVALLGAGFGSALMGGAPAAAATRAAPQSTRGALQSLDTDHDGTVDLAEAKAAASKLFARLDRDHDGTLDRRELRGRMVSKEFAAANRDRDGTLDKAEYLAAVEKAFRAADRDNDGTLDANELSSPRGRVLLRLLQ